MKLGEKVAAYTRTITVYMGNSLGNGITIQKKIQFFVSNILTLI